MKVLQVKLLAYREHCPGKAEGAGSSPVGRTSFFSGNGMASQEANVARGASCIARCPTFG